MSICPKSQSDSNLNENSTLVSRYAVDPYAVLAILGFLIFLFYTIYNFLNATGNGRGLFYSIYRNTTRHENSNDIFAHFLSLISQLDN